MVPSFSNYFLLLVVIVLIYLLLRKSQESSQPSGPVKGTDITGDSGSPLRKWDCSYNNHQIVFSDVPAGLTPYRMPVNEEELRRAGKENFKVLHSIVADIRFRDADMNEVERFEPPITMWMSYSAEDVLSLRSSGYTVEDLMPVKIVPGKTGWVPFGKDKVDYSQIVCGTYGGVKIMIDSWGDPPTGWGSPKLG